MWEPGQLDSLLLFTFNKALFNPTLFQLNSCEPKIVLHVQ